MADKQINLDFYARVETDLSSIKGAVSELKRQLGSLEIPKNASKGFERSLESLNAELQNFEAMATRGVTSLSDTKKMDTSWRKISTIFSSLGIQIKELGDIDFFPKEVTSNIEKANKALASYQSKVEEIKKSQTYKNKISAKGQAEADRQSAMVDWQREKKKLESMERSSIANKAAWDQNRSKEYAEQTQKLAELNSQIEQQNKALAEQRAIQQQLHSMKVITKDGQIRESHSAALNKAKAKQEELKATKAAVQEQEELAKEQEKAAKKALSSAKGQETKARKKGDDKDPKVVAAIEARTRAEQAYADAKAKRVEVTQNLEKIEKDLAATGTKVDELESQQGTAKAIATQIEGIEAQKRTLESSRDAVKKAAKENEAFKTSLDASGIALQDQRTRVETHKATMDAAEQAIENFNNELKQMELSGAASEWTQLTEIVRNFTGIDLSGFQGDVTQITKVLNDYKNGQIKDTPELIKKLKEAAGAAAPAMQHLKEETAGAKRELEEMGRAEKEMENLKNQILEFFSVSNAIQIFKNAVRDAFDTVKELDAAMTETAVVTDFSIGDMWDKLPQYSEEATKLGASIKSLYEATTLYYQQGLNSEQAMGVGIETMKMARIANMDAAAATEAMTAALRGFNMEINETSATRINDVYSELAAITAADTSQIATAMSKTASIAESANMEFETTAALLAQIIETTQEAPETAGTAMKTIIARFTEVKQLFSEGMLTGEDSEGEEININKIDAALKTVGISLKDFLNGSKGIDDIFLELASKWDTLDLATQRYIATTAAGSRQQSRFLAMMSNYDRTMELVTAANNSAGASQKQFDKTTESLEAKIQRLENAWAEFTMGLANSDVIKWAVDLLTDLIECVNKLTGFTGNDGLGGVITMFLRLGTVIGALKGGKGILDGLLKTISSGLGNPKLLTKITDNFVSQDMGILQALFTKKKAEAGGFGKFSAEAKAASKTLNGVGGAFGKAGTTAKVFFGLLKKFIPYIAVFATLSIVIGKVVKSFNEAQRSAQMEKLNGTLDELSDEAEEANSKLSEIGSDRNNLKTLQSTLDNLVKGTNEWKQALINTNQEVLNLIEKYPELINFLSTGSSGQLVISSEGWDEVYEQQRQLVLDLTNQKLATQVQISELQSGMNFDNFVIEMPEETAKAEGTESSVLDTKLTEFELKMARFMDSEFSILGWKPGITWGDVISGANDGAYAQQGNLGFSYSELNEDVKEQGGYAAVTEREKTGGLTEKEYTAFAAALAEEGITLSDGLTDSERMAAQNIYRNFNYDMDFFDPVIDKAAKLGTAFDELGNTVLTQQLIEEQNARTFVGNAVTGTKTVGELEYADAIASLITETRNYDKELIAKIDAQEKVLDTKYADNDSLAKAYAERFGKYYADGKVYEDASMEKEIPVIREGMIEALATADITLEIQQESVQIANMMKGKTDKQEQLFDDLFSAEGSEIGSDQLVKYQKDGKIDYNQIALDMGFESLQDMATKFGTTIEEITETLESNFESATDRIAKQRRNLTKRMTKYAVGEDDTYVENANDLAGLEKKFGEQIRYTLEDVFNSLERTDDFDVISQGFDFFKNVALSGTKEDVEELTKFIDNIDWSDPIASVYKLNKEIENGTTLTKGFAQTVMEVDASFFSASSQFEAFFASDVYKDIQEDLDEIYDTQGKITEGDVRELASEYSYLNKMMKNTSTTAKGLADILQSIEEGKLEFEDLTDAVIAAAGGMNQLGDSTNKVLEKLKNLDLGDDLGEVQDTYTEWADMIKEFQEGGEFGNPQYKGVLEYIFGKGFEGDRTGQELIDWYQTLGDRVEKLYGKDMFYGWEQAARGLDIYGQAIETQGIAKLKELGIQLEMINGEVVFNVPDDMTFDQTAANLAEVVGGTKEHWEDMLTYFANRTPEIWRTWDMADYNQIGKRVAEEGSADILGHKFVTNQDVENITTQASIKYADKDPADIREEIEDQLSKNEVEILTLLDTEDIVTQAENIVSQLNNVFGGDNAFTNQFVEKLESGISSLDFTALMSAISALPIPENVGEQIANSIAAGVAELGGQITYEVEGEPRVLDLNLVANGTEFVEAINAQVAQAEEMTEGAELDSTASVTIDEAAWEASVNSAKSYINGVLNKLRYPITAYVDSVDTSAVPSDTGSGSSSSSSGSKVGSLDWYLTMAADGDPGVTYKHDSLVGEEGPELIETKDGAYLSGVGGPQVTTLHRGDVVHTAEETQEIFKRKGVPLPSFSKGGTIGPAPGSSSGGSSKDDDEDTWENPFDKLYNLVRKIDEELRQRERIERRYEKLLESIDVSANAIIKVSREELAQLERERMLQESLATNRRYQINQYQSENADLTKYANVVQNDRGEDVLRINWDLINSVTDTDEGGRIEDYVSQLEEWFDSLEEAEDALWDIEDAVEEIKERGEEEYFEMEDAIKEALTQSYQDEIDKLSQINESINNTNSSLLDAIQKSIDKQRQDRDNQRTEDDLAEKQRRLLYLQQDTSGANAMEILKLQEEISQGQEDYTDTLIDQKISELQEQNDEAAKQRDQQITIAQSQLDHYIETGRIWQEVYGLMDDGLDKDTGLIRGSRLEEILKNSDNFIGMSEIAKMEWLNDTNNMIAQALAYLEIGRQLEDIGAQSGSQIEFTTSDGRVLTGTVNDDGSVTASDGWTYNNVFQGYDGKYYADENIADVEEPVVEEATNNQSGSSGSSGSSISKKNNPYGVASEQGNYTARNGTMWSSGVKAIQWALNDMGYDAGTIDGGYGYATSQAIQRFQRAEGIKVDGDYGSQTREKMRLRGYKTGGLADFTGPAWLDGTKARPELVLNQRDTQNFIQLKDILASLMSNGTHTSTENNGDTIYDIDINVESIGNDYDVEQVANKVKSMINDNARYRNNNTISLAR